MLGGAGVAAMFFGVFMLGFGYGLDKLRAIEEHLRPRKGETAVESSAAQTKG